MTQKTLREAAQMALEALDYAERVLSCDADKPSRLNVAKLAKDAAKAITAALALPDEPVERKPLTAVEIDLALCECWDLEYVRLELSEDQEIEFVRAIEAAHGIKGGA